MELNKDTGGNRRFILVQLPEPVEVKGNFQTIFEVTKARVKAAGKRIKDENPLFAGDLGFRVFKLDSTNIREWDPNRDNLAVSLEASVDHLKTDRTEQDILFELLLKLGLDLCVPIETKKIGEHDVHNIGAGTLLVCLSRSIPSSDVEPLALGLVAWHKELKPAGETTVVFRDSAFADDVAKTNLTAILEQNGITNVRSL
jgi:adenine-specific DNA-methyltransferase